MLHYTKEGCAVFDDGLILYGPWYSSGLLRILCLFYPGSFLLPYTDN